jgi:hypothetical protein
MRVVIAPIGLREDAVAAELRFEVNRRICEEYDDCRQYAPCMQADRASQNVAWRPDSAALFWHNDNCFKG